MKNRQQCFSQYPIMVASVFLMLPQGGFFDAIWSLCGVVTVVYLCFRGKKTLPFPILIFILSLIFVYTLSASIHGFSGEALSALCRLTVFFLLLLMLNDMDIDAHELIFVMSTVAAGIGFLTFSGALHWEGAVASGRLQSVFQYANAAGIFLGVGALMTNCNPKRTSFSFLIETALLLTQSLGALITYALAWFLYFGLKAQERGRILSRCCGFFISLLAAGVIYTLRAYVGYPPLTLLPSALLFLCRNTLSRISENFSAKKGTISAGIGVFLLTGVWLLALRGGRPLATFQERLVQIADGIRLMANQPLGAGPGAWQFHFMAWQSAPYTASKIHCEYVAVGVDAGFFALVLLCLFLALWFRRQKWDEYSICGVMLALHALMDIPFSFLSLALITALLLVKTFPPSRRIVAVPTAFLFIPLALCFVVLYSSLLKNMAAWAADAGNTELAATRLAGVFPRNDTEAILLQMSVCLDAGKGGTLDAIFMEMPRPNAEAYYLKALSLLQRKKYAEAADAALQCARLSPYDQSGFILLKQIIPKLVPEVRCMYREQVDGIKWKGDRVFLIRYQSE